MCLSIVSSSVAIKNSIAERHERESLFNHSNQKTEDKGQDEKDLAKDIPSDLLTHSAISSSMIQPTDEVNIIMTNDTIIFQYCHSWELRLQSMSFEGYI